MSYERSDADLIERLQEQVGFLRRSALAFDEGQHSESQRLAATVRILCYHRAQSRALLQQLGLLDQLQFVDTIPEVASSTDPLEGPVDEADGSWHTVTVFSGPLAPIAGDPAASWPSWIGLCREAVSRSTSGGAPSWPRCRTIG